ncbi:MAG: hypothetical protein KF901_23800 [Myxococcales bacterium]|nr:hypothetical protein [Myxococcales bacterium]
MSFDAYEQARASAGKLKVKARAKLAFDEPDETFEACVLLHEAARIERRAVRLIDAAVETKLTALAEACACLLMGLDPPGAIKVWGEIVQLRSATDSAADILGSLEARVEKARLHYGKKVAPLRFFSRAPQTAEDRHLALSAVESMLAEFPGIGSFWWARYWLLANSTPRRKAEAWRSIERARRLAPDDPYIEASAVLAGVDLLPAADAHALLRGARAVLQPERPLLCLTTALAELRLTEGSSKATQAEAHRRALYAARVGLAGAPPSPWFEELRATHNVLELLLADRVPTLDVLYQAGLADIALHAKPGEPVVDLLTQSVLEKMASAA